MSDVMSNQGEKTMDKFGQYNACAKCGDSRASVKFLSAHAAADGYPAVPERIERVCEKCGYRWSEAPLDAADAPVEFIIPAALAEKIRRSLDPDGGSFHVGPPTVGWVKVP